MKNIFKYSFILIIIIFFANCKKNKPPTGEYYATFWGTYKDTSSNIITINRYLKLYIIHTEKSSITMSECPTCDRFSLSKGKKNKINGVIDIRSVSGADIGYISEAITIDGKWEKFNGKYYIKGDFSYNYEIIDTLNHNVYVVTGEFEIKSN